MNVNNNAKRATIAEIQGNFFEIPPYQRLYEWEKEQIETLLDDMKKACGLDKKEEKVENKKEYFIGTITISAKTNKKEQDKENNDKNKVYKLIDGQQRLTTLWFIGFYLASNEKCGEWQKKWQKFIVQGENLRIVMPIRDSEENALKELTKKIIDGKYKFKQDKDNKIAPFEESQNIHQKIIEAFSCIESWFVNGNGKNIDLADFAKYIYENVCFVFVTLAQNTNLNRFFVRMNNRGKQLEKHEILKARILGEIRKVYDKNGELRQDENDEIWQKYAKIWDLCSDMDKYIFQSASDRNIFGNPKNKTGQDNSGQSIDEIINNPSTDSNNNAHKDDDNPKKVESIIDSPTFLLHCYKLWVAKKCKNKDSEIPKEVTITKDKLLDIMWDAKDERNKHDYLLIKCGKQDCKEFIIDMLRYRVLFDYFVIKNDTNIKQGNTFRIRRLESYKSGENTYYRLPDDSKSVSDNSPFKALATLQNYLRVARQGERQNYHHWLTPFLKFLNNYIRLDMILTLDEIKEFNFDNFKDNAEKIAKQFSVANKCDGQEKVLINFLENLDTKLAIVQLNKTSENDWLDATNKVLQDLHKANESHNLDTADWDFLNHGTETPHYWFYRLEYYLWKWGKDKPEKLGSFCKKLDDYSFDLKAKNCVLNSNYFHFRMLGSIEHFSAVQRQDKRKKEWNLDIFGNLALISQNFNSSLSNELENFKKEKVIEQLKRGRLESLKYFIMCANLDLNSNEWTVDDAQEHQNQMIDILIKSLNSKANK